MAAKGPRSVASFVLVLLNIAVGMMVLGLILIVVLVFVMPVATTPLEVDASWLTVGSRMTIPVSFTVDPRVHPVSAPALGVAQAQLRDVTGRLMFPASGGGFLIANIVVLVTLFVASWWVLHQLRAVVRTVRDGHPFVPENATRTRWIGAAVIAGELVRSAIYFGESYYARTYFKADGLQFEAWPAVNVIVLANGLIILVLAEIFRTGTRLEEDQSLTI